MVVIKIDAKGSSILDSSLFLLSSFTNIDAEVQKCCATNDQLFAHWKSSFSDGESPGWLWCIPTILDSPISWMEIVRKWTKKCLRFPSRNEHLLQNPRESRANPKPAPAQLPETVRVLFLSPVPLLGHPTTKRKEPWKVQLADPQLWFRNGLQWLIHGY